MIADIKNKPLSFQLGYMSFWEKKEKKDIPVNSFSHPKLQKKRYRKGWETAKKDKDKGVTKVRKKWLI